MGCLRREGRSIHGGARSTDQFRIAVHVAGHLICYRLGRAGRRRQTERAQLRLDVGRLQCRADCPVYGDQPPVAPCRPTAGGGQRISFETQQEVIKAGPERAQRDKVELLIHGRDGQNPRAQFVRK
ncbi:DUF2188 domain-containing protein [Cupriavidus campinensis]|uniref:DUF2188 domain-containing protein n=1 Tax=Cupriavidus campinensis TaxID=151783 RepID=UPI00292A4730|nr:DUF2188 domain-containing protein [Cupriavidus campinensis]